MPTQTGSIDFKSTKGFQSYASGQYATLTQVKGQFATCSTAAGTQAKAATIVPSDTGWELYTGATITVKFTTDNTHATPTLNVNSTGAKSIRDHTGAALTEEAYKWKAGDALAFTYDGTYWRMQDTLAQRVTTNKTAIEQNASDILLRATKTEASQMAQPNLAPLGSVDFSNVYNATTNPDGYWRSTPSSWFMQLEDGWVHCYKDNTSGTAATNTTSWRPSPSPSVEAGKVYTILTEIRNNNSSGSSQTDMYLQQIANNQFWGDINGATIDDDHVTTTTSVSLRTCGETYVRYSYRIADTEHLTTDPVELFRYNFRLPAGCKFDFDFRQSVYEGIYDGPYKPYVGSQLYASQAELKVTNDSISSKVSTTDYNGQTIASLINQSADSVVIEAEHIELNGTTVFNTIKSSLDSNYDAKGAAETIEQALGGFDILWNRPSFASDTDAGGECYLCAYDPTTAIRTDANGWAMWNGTKRTIAKGMFNPNKVLPYNIPIYIVCRLSSSTATTGTNYMVWYNSGWKSGPMSPATSTITDWTWAESTDMVLGKFVEPGSEAAFTECETYRQPLKWGAITTDTVTARSANAAAASAQTTANNAAPKASAVKRTQRIWYRKSAAGAPATPGTASSNWVVKADDGSNAWTKMHVSITETEKFIYTCEQYEMANGTIGYTSVLLDNTITVIDGGTIITNSVTANQIAASTITGEEIAANTIDGNNIKGSTITAEHLSSAFSLDLGKVEGLKERLESVEQGVSGVQTNTQWVHFDQSVGTVFGREGSANNVTITNEGIDFNTDEGRAAWATGGVFHANEMEADTVDTRTVVMGDWALVQSGTTFYIDYIGS